MLNEEEILKQKEKKKKMLIKIVIIVVGIFVLAGIVLFILSAWNNHLDDEKKKAYEDANNQNYSFQEPNYDLNIFSDENYMNLDRSIWVNDGVAKTVISDENFSSYSQEVQFMKNVVEMIIKGDYESYNAIFTDEYMRTADAKDIREVFTMQQLYNIELEILEYAQNGNTVNSVIKVSYMIRLNNGTFRNDLPEGAIRAVVYMLNSTSDRTASISDIKVSNLMPYSQYAAGLY